MIDVPWAVVAVRCRSESARVDVADQISGAGRVLGTGPTPIRLRRWRR